MQAAGRRKPLLNNGRPSLRQNLDNKTSVALHSDDGRSVGTQAWESMSVGAVRVEQYPQSLAVGRHCWFASPPSTRAAKFDRRKRCSPETVKKDNDEKGPSRTAPKYRAFTSS